jgi:hypothetical protein
MTINPDGSVTITERELWEAIRQRNRIVEIMRPVAATQSDADKAADNAVWDHMWQTADAAREE